MMREIKFRGKTLTTGEFAYGDLTRWNGSTCVGGYYVDANSVQQFCGYGDNGEEIYEGDTVVDADGYKYVANLLLCGVIDDCNHRFVFYLENGKERLKLKKGAD